MVGNVKNEIGVLFSKDNFMLIKKKLKKDEKIEKHNHENEEIIFTVLKGKVEVFLNEKENHITVFNIIIFEIYCQLIFQIILLYALFLIKSI